MEPDDLPTAATDYTYVIFVDIYESHHGVEHYQLTVAEHDETTDEFGLVGERTDGSEMTWREPSDRTDFLCTQAKDIGIVEFGALDTSSEPVYGPEFAQVTALHDHVTHVVDRSFETRPHVKSTVLKELLRYAGDFKNELLDAARRKLDVAVEIVPPVEAGIKPDDEILSDEASTYDTEQKITMFPSGDVPERTLPEPTSRTPTIREVENSILVGRKLVTSTTDPDRLVTADSTLEGIHVLASFETIGREWDGYNIDVRAEEGGTASRSIGTVMHMAGYELVDDARVVGDHSGRSIEESAEKSESALDPLTMFTSETDESSSLDAKLGEADTSALDDALSGDRSSPDAYIPDVDVDKTDDRSLSQTERATILTIFAARLGVERLQLNGIRVYQTTDDDDDEVNIYVVRVLDDDGDWVELTRVSDDKLLDWNKTGVYEFIRQSTGDARTAYAKLRGDDV